VRLGKIGGKKSPESCTHDKELKTELYRADPKRQENNRTAAKQDAQEIFFSFNSNKILTTMNVTVHPTLFYY
jgi:hypothetical protein